MKVLGVVLGGGQGTRLFPLTSERSKPAVPLAGKYRLVDIPISNCLNSGINQIFVLTQFNSTSLNRHIAQAYKFDLFTSAFVDILAAEQTLDNANWFQGTADAVRQSMRHIERDADLVLITSGDALYRMDYRPMIQRHIEANADISIAVIPVEEARASSFGLLKIDDERRIVEFKEKPKTPEALHPMASPEHVLARCGVHDTSRRYLASMGIYLFNLRALDHALARPEQTDFGKEVIPSAIKEQRVFAELYEGYWEDIGTIKAFYDANLLLTETEPPFDFFDSAWPIYTRARFLPAAKLRECMIDHAIIADGCVISNATVRRSVVGLRSVIAKGAIVEDSVLMGCDNYTHHAHTIPTRVHHLSPNIEHCAVVRRAIIDKNAFIGERAVIEPPPGAPDRDGAFYHIRDGIAIIPRGVHVPADFNLPQVIASS
jgi:glucose-1-phosphate adenylyltransferase